MGRVERTGTKFPRGGGSKFEPSQGDQHQEAAKMANLNYETRRRKDRRQEARINRTQRRTRKAPPSSSAF